MIPYDLVGVLKRGLEKDRRPPDGLLHCSSDLLGSLRHAQLRLAGAPTIESELVADIRLRTGTMWHEHFRDLMTGEGLAVMGEVRLDPWLPEGWSGTADWLFWDFDKRCFVLGDLKTIKGSGLYYIEREGVKPEHEAQLSAYYWAMVEAKMPVRKGFFVCYLPMDQDSGGREYEVEPVIIESLPIPKNELWPEMEYKWGQCQAYLARYRLDWKNAMSQHPAGKVSFINDRIASTPERTQKMFWDKGNGRFDLKLVPDWRTRFCPYPNELCDCSEQGSTKIGHYEMNTDEVKYVPRKGYENVVPLFGPSAAEFNAKAA